MNKIILTLLMTILFTPAANAQNCVNSSRCDELGYTKTAADCAGLDTLVCPFDSNKVFCVFSEQDCEIGDILYEDKSCAALPQSGKTAIGVIFSAASRLAIALDERELTWGGHGNEIGSAAQGNWGKSNTEAILAYGKANNISYPAAEYCNQYRTSGTGAGDWVLPSLDELRLLSGRFSEVNSTLTLLGKSLIDGYYWSSSEYNNYNVRRLVPSSGDTGYYIKTSSYRVRPVLAF